MIGFMGFGLGVNVLLLCICKVDVVVGFLVGKDEELCKIEGGGGDFGVWKWVWSGKWVVVFFFIGL